MLLQGGDDRAGVEAKCRDLSGREFKENHFILRTQNVDFPDIGNGQYLGANVFDVIPQLALAQAVAGESVDVAEHIAEAIVEVRPDDPLRKIAFDIRDHVAHPNPGRVDVTGLRAVAQIDEHRCLARDSYTLRVIK